MISRVVRPALAAAFFLALATASGAKPPFNFETTPGKLPKDVVPVDYQISITPDPATMTLAGSETIALDVRKAVSTISLNSLNERLTEVKLDGVAASGVQSDDQKQTTTITLAQPAGAGRHTLTFAYTGKLETAPQGLFVQPYRTGATRGTMISTQFEATDARRMFPCWDEPAFRATFQLTATVPSAWSVVSNMPIDRQTPNGATTTTTFQRTPKMPTYLVEFSAGDLAHIDADAGGRHFGVWAVRGQEQNGALALGNAKEILADYDAYFGFPYPLPKLDSIAVPGGFSGAMENWGAITYNDQTLLAPPAATLEQQQRVFSIQAHEIAHQWNGDLVTMGWWDDIWLNESFASWMAAKETALRNPTWKWWEREDAAKELAMAADARLNSHPIEQHVTNEMEAEASFDSAITYNKGQAVLRMLESYLGEQTFRDGIRRYIKARAYSNATSGDLWQGLSAASGTNIEAIASSWTTQAGFPLVSVHATCDAGGNRRVAFSQQRFVLGGTVGNQSWVIPVEMRSGANGTVHRALLTRNGHSVRAGRCDEPLTANVETVGFYRVAYDAPTLRENTRAFASLPNADKIGMLDDQWALVEAGRAPLGAYLALASALRTDLDARAWDQVAVALATIERDERGTPGHDAFTAYARALLRPVFAQVGFDPRAGEDPSVREVRRTVVQRLGEWGDPSAVREARRRFAQFVADPSTINPEQQPAYLAIVAQNADQATFDQLHAIAKGSTNETQARRYYTALAAVRDPKLVQQTLEILMSSELPPQMANQRTRIITAMAPNNPHVVWEFYKAHVDELTGSSSQFSRALSISRIPSAFWDAAPLNELEAFVKEKAQPAPGPMIARAMEQARFNMALKSRLIAAADGYIKTHHLAAR